MSQWVRRGGRTGSTADLPGLLPGQASGHLVKLAAYLSRC